MKLTFLGTGTSQGMPVIACPCSVCHSLDPLDQRLRSSVLIEQGNNIISIDCGPDFRQQMLRQRVQRLDAVLLTHAHFDHIGGLDDVRSFNYLLNSPMTLYGNSKALQGVRKVFAYAFEEKPYPGAPSFDLKEINADPFWHDDLWIEPISFWHKSLPVLGYRMGSLAYITDANRIDADQLARLEGLDVLIINALRKKPHPSHFSLGEALKIVEILKPKLCYFTHISHYLGRHAQVEGELPKNVHLAYDGLQIQL